jgi:hypothetical protein
MWSAPAERSGDGALDSFGVVRFANPKRSRATLASALQNEFFSSLLGGVGSNKLREVRRSRNPRSQVLVERSAYPQLT